MHILLGCQIWSSYARQCYVCGIGANDPLYSTIILANADVSGNRQADGQRIHETTEQYRQSSEEFDLDIDMETKNSQRDAPSCEELEEAAWDAFLVECPSSYMGCFTQSDGECSNQNLTKFLSIHSNIIHNHCRHPNCSHMQSILYRRLQNCQSSNVLLLQRGSLQRTGVA